MLNLHLAQYLMIFNVSVNMGLLGTSDISKLFSLIPLKLLMDSSSRSGKRSSFKRSRSAGIEDKDITHRHRST